MKEPEQTTRPRYPSDDAWNAERRKTKPHVRVHLSVKNHPKTAEVWADVQARGMLVELWRLGSERGAAHTGDWLTLAPGDVVTITGRTQYAHATRALRTLAERMEYAMRERGACVEIHLRNFARKQGLPPREARSDLRTPQPSPTPTSLRTPQVEDNARPSARSTATWFDDVFLPAYPAHRQGTQLKSARSFVTRTLRPDEQTRAKIMRHLAAWKASADWRDEGGKYVVGLKRFFDDQYHERLPAERPASTAPSNGHGLRKLRLADDRIVELDPRSVRFTDAKDALTIQRLASGLVVVRKGAEWV